MGSIDFSSIIERFTEPEILLAIAFIGGFALLSSVINQNKGELTTGKFAGFLEKLNAAQKAESQIKKQKANKITFYCGSPRYWKILGRRLPVTLQFLLGGKPTLYFPDSERSALVIGAPGSGKTASILDPAMQSAINQDKSVICYDKKGDQLAWSIPYALRRGYNAKVFAPGFPFTCSVNPLDFLVDESDATMAREIGRVLQENGKSGENSGSGDEFFMQAGEQVIQGVLQLAKSVENRDRYGDAYQGCADFVMAYSFLQLPQFVKRLDHAVSQGAIAPFVAASFTQLLSIKEAEKTISGVLGNASSIFSNLIQRDLIPCFLGKSSIPLGLGEKMMLGFQLDEDRRSAVAPLLASVMHLCIIHNARSNRKTSLLVMLDEFPSLKFSGIEQKINEHRSRGISYYLGAQTLDQIYFTYGERKGNAIIDAASTKVVFNCGGSVTSAERFSKSFGEEEKTIKSKSRSFSQSGNTRSVSESNQKKTLVSVDQINRLPSGSCYVVNPAYGSQKEGSFPFREKVFIPPKDFKMKEKMEALWEEKVKLYLEKQERKKRGDISIVEALERRKAIAAEILPLPPKDGEGENDESQTVNMKKPSPKYKLDADSDADEKKEDPFNGGL